ncbi:MAG: hypothetical protein GY855_07690, partial [candidate division Zixibacteria bacterium]|nr:hypothetical protein [candidate division Zixibacteria bacterium]
MKLFINILLLLIVLTALSSGQSVLTNKRNTIISEFRADYSEFYDISTGKSRLEIYYQVFNSDLLFIRKGESFTANYSISVSIYNKKNIPIISETKDKEIVVE